MLEGMNILTDKTSTIELPLIITCCIRKSPRAYPSIPASLMEWAVYGRVANIMYALFFCDGEDAPSPPAIHLSNPKTSKHAHRAISVFYGGDGRER